LDALSVWRRGGNHSNDSGVVNFHDQKLLQLKTHPAKFQGAFTYFFPLPITHRMLSVALPQNPKSSKL
jgi:hypothetical protein